MTADAGDDGDVDADGAATEPVVDPAYQAAFDDVWTQLPAMQNWSSSSWWFFILFPESDDGYGPRQLMFSIATCAGDRVRVNDVPFPGFDPKRSVRDGQDSFHAMVVGWDGDDESVEEGIINQAVEMTLSATGESIAGWTTAGHDAEGGDHVVDDADHGSFGADADDAADADAAVDAAEEAADSTEGPGALGRRGAEIQASEDHPLGFDAQFVGEQGAVEFSAWGDLDSPVTGPVKAMDAADRVDRTDVVAWRRMHFDGEFDLPAGREHLQGVCYFQRVCLNGPTIPWKWIWAYFADGTSFSTLIPYIGPHLFRRGYGFFDSQTLERATIPIRHGALWNWADDSEIVAFDRASVDPILYGDDGHPDFEVTVRNDDGDHVSFVASTYGHVRNHLERPVLGGLFDSHWSYNEYLFRMRDLTGQVGDRTVSTDALGDAFGTLEYAWGLGL